MLLSWLNSGRYHSASTSSFHHIKFCPVQRQYTANFTEADVPFTVMGYFPDRSLVSPGVMLTGVMWKDRLTMDLYYNGEFGQKYSDHNYGGQLRIGF